MMIRAMVVLFLLGGMMLATDDVKDRVLFSFEEKNAAQQWQAVNDGVMGGRSDGRLKITDNKTMEFIGTLSLENNGGFASVRTRASTLGLKKNDILVAKVRGDGREYAFNLYTSSRSTAFSYRTPFQTKKDEWVEVELPLDKFIATSFGQIVQNQPLAADAVTGVGILLGDKKAGVFKLEVEWIKVRTSQPAALQPQTVR
jgi:NADH dehydrogenase [ubiquinone] 1 alpha subcomplex assembly factor 1